MKTSRALAALLAAAATLPGFSQPTTGFNQTGAGPFDYNNTANWVGGAINGIWDVSLINTANQTATFGANSALSTGLNFGYTGNFDLTLRSDGIADRTITLGGDITAAPVSNRTINFGSTTANEGLNINLGGNRTFNVNTNKTLRFYNTISGGNISATGGGTLSLAGSTANASASNIDVQANTTLYFDTTVSGTSGTTRAANIDLLSGAKLSARGNNGINTEDTISGNVTIGGGSPATAATGLSSITVQSGTKNSLLTVTGTLQRVNNGVGLIRGNALGANSIASATANSTNIQVVGTAPTLVGGGGASSSTNISIVPWLIGGTTVTDNGSTFLTYTTANGFRPLDTATEFATTIVDGTSSTNNVKLSANTVLTSSTTINSLLITPTVATTISGGTLNVTSGAILVNPANTNVTTIISSDLNFGSAQGVMGNGTRTAKFNKISGSGGLVLYSPGGTSGTWTTDTGANSSDYTGDTYIYSKLDLFTAGSTTFLPSSARTGDVYVYGQLFTAAGTQTINGLNGTGAVNFGHSGGSTLIVGDNNANGLFSGVIGITTNFNPLSLVKIGNGTQQLTGSSSLYAGSTTILGGTLEITALTNGGASSGTSIGSSSNTSTNLVLNGGALKYTGVTTSTDRLFQVGQTTTGAIGTINASGTGAVNFTNTGAITYGTAGTTGVAQTRTLILTGTNTGTNTLSALIGNNGSATNGNSDVSVTKSGTGTWILAGANTYKGATTIDAGTLALGVNNAINVGSAIDLNTGGTFDLKTFSTSAAALDFAAGSTLKFNLGASGNVTALLALTNTLSKTSTGVFTLDFSGSGQAGTYNLLSFSSTAFTNQNEFTIANLGSGLTGNLVLNATSLSLVVSAIPEPSTYAIFAGASCLLLVVGRRIRRSA